MVAPVATLPVDASHGYLGPEWSLVWATVNADIKLTHFRS